MHVLAIIGPAVAFIAFAAVCFAAGPIECNRKLDAHWEPQKLSWMQRCHDWAQKSH
jgi:hypothetical protein